jgi:signal transduction histidine kinase
MPASIISKHSDKRRLQLVLLLFFLALAVPTLILIKYTYNQLKWEAFHQHLLLAEELALRIDRRMNELIQAEEARAFADYAFLIVAGDPAANFLQPSALSAYPPTAGIPGLVGYFQIDADDAYSTPLLPPSDSQASAYGIDVEQLTQRKSLQAHIRQILSENRLVQRKKTGKPAEEAPAANGMAVQLDEATEHERQTQASQGAVSGLLAGREDAAEAVLPRLFDPYKDDASAAETKPTAEPLAYPPASPQPSIGESYFSSGSPQQAESDASGEEMPAQMAFDRLSVEESKTTARAAGKKSAELRVEDLKLNDVYEQKAKGDFQNLSKNIAEIPQRAARKERTILPESALKAEIPGARQAQSNAPVKINIFESELDPFEISLLDSGHFILFRKVWRNGQRYIQGALIEQQPFINGIVETLFRETALSQSSGLAAAYDGEVLASFTAMDGDRYLRNEELGGALLYRTHLSAPFTGLELIFNLSRLPAGPGGTVVGWVAIIIMLVLCGGSWLMYRLGLRQIALVNQQQDFVSAVSHELKTPLTSIRMYGEMLKQGWVDENKRKTYYDFIFDESERLTRLINNVLQLARLTRNDFDIHSKPVTIGELLDNVRSKISTQIERAGFTLNMHIGENAHATLIKVDTDIFTQILINLVDNAIKFSAKAEIKSIDIEARVHSDGNAVFSVRDYGPGIPVNQMKKIFRLFYRSGSELTRETPGTGIGLALVRQLTQAMDGQADVLNREPGAEFHLSFVTLPATSGTT